MDRNTAVHTNSETPIFTKKIGKTTYIAVSYTHLDVYKRQFEPR